MLLPRAKRFQQLNDPITIAVKLIVIHVSRARLCLLIEQQVDQAKKSFENVVVAPVRTFVAIEDGATSRVLDRPGDLEEFEPTTDGTLGGYLRATQMIIRPFNELRLNEWVLLARQE
jgi:hypothetical protein